MDIDLMGRTDNSLEHIRFVVEEICGLAVDQDGVEFREETLCRYATIGACATPASPNTR
jgi:hypothetical protein